MKDVYQPREDSYLLLNCMEEYVKNGDCVLEVGVGSGYVLSSLQKGEKNLDVIGSDISRYSVEKAHDSIDRIVQSNLSNCFSDNSFDLIAFNLPYLQPSERDDKLDQEALSYRDDLLQDFLSESSRCLKQDGTCIFVLSSKTPVNPISKIDSSELEIVRSYEEKHFFEHIKCFVCQ